MSSGVYGTKRASDVSPADVEIFYHFVSERKTTSDVTFTKLISTDILTPIYHNDNTGGTTDKEILGGLYNLKLDSSIFSELGIYTLYLRPKQIRTVITDCGVLSSLPSVRGLILELSNIPVDERVKFVPQGLVGYRIEYLDDEGNKVPNFYRIVTSSFYCEPIITNSSNTSQKSIRYKYTDTATNLLFLTLTPSAAASTRPNITPYIGQPNQNIILNNTYFNPLTIEIEMVEHDSSTLAHALYGNQSKSIADGIYTIYDKENNIYKQYNLYEIKDEINETLFEIREERSSIDESLDFDIITE